MPNRSRASVGSLQSHEVLSSTRTEKCNICNSAGQGRLWKCCVCRNCKHPTCIGLESDEDNHQFVCPQCQPPSGGVTQASFCSSSFRYAHTNSSARIREFVMVANITSHDRSLIVGSHVHATKRSRLFPYRHAKILDCSVILVCSTVSSKQLRIPR